MQANELGGEQASSSTQRDDKLVMLLAEAFEARSLILANPATSLNRLASEHSRCRSRLSKLFVLSHLAPDIIQSIVAGAQPAGLSARKLLAMELPMRWDEQRRMLEVA